jgi:hypothetical protein
MRIRPYLIILGTTCIAATLALAQTEPTSASTATTAPAATQATTGPVATRVAPPKPVPAKKIDGKQVLRQFVGTFDVTSKTRPGPDEAWVELKGEEIGQLTLNDRFVQSVSTLAFSADDKRFYITLTGFDPATQKFQFVSLGDDGDAMLTGNGTANPEGNRLELKTDDARTRFVINFDARGYGVRLFTRDATDKEFLAAEDRYERRK